jgi:hypothetical protein
MMYQIVKPGPPSLDPSVRDGRSINTGGAVVLISAVSGADVVVLAPTVVTRAVTTDGVVVLHSELGDPVGKYGAHTPPRPAHSTAEDTVASSGHSQTPTWPNVHRGLAADGW